jgi:hypothetical protein
MNFTTALYSAILFFILTPNIFLRFPSKGSTKVVALVHAAIFGVILYLTQKSVWKASSILENFASSADEIRAIDSAISQKKSECETAIRELENKKTITAQKQMREQQNQIRNIPKWR